MLCDFDDRLVSLAVLICLGATVAAAESDWPRFGGPNGDFHTDDSNLIKEWDSKNIIWKTELGGTGQSSPVTWGGQIFLTTSDSAGGRNVNHYVMCLNRADGTIAWKQLVATGPGETIHKMNSYASASCHH